MIHTTLFTDPSQVWTVYETQAHANNCRSEIDQIRKLMSVKQLDDAEKQRFNVVISKWQAKTDEFVKRADELSGQ